MNNSFNEIPEITQTSPPGIPPEIPFNPSVPQTNVSVPMVYVEKHEQVEYQVKSLENPDAKQLEAELKAFGRDGWWLIQVIHQEKDLLLIFSRKARD